MSKPQVVVLCFLAGCGAGDERIKAASFSDDAAQAIYLVESGPFDDTESRVEIAQIQNDMLGEPRLIYETKDYLSDVFFYRASGRILIAAPLRVRIFEGGAEKKVIEWPAHTSGIVPSHDGRYVYYHRSVRDLPAIYDLDLEREHPITLPNIETNWVDRIFWHTDGRLFIRGHTERPLDNPFLTTYSVVPGEEPVLEETLTCFKVPTSSWPVREDGRMVGGYRLPPVIYPGDPLECR